MKRCSKCKRVLPLSEFGRDCRVKDGRQAVCKECKSATGRAVKPVVPDDKMRARYRKIRVNGKQVPLHRHIIEQALGRELARDEVVHHINGNKLDNRLENLQVLKVGEHSRIENLGKRLTEEHRHKIGLSLIGNQHLKGHYPSPETRAKLSAALIGNKRAARHKVD